MIVLYLWVFGLKFKLRRCYDHINPAPNSVQKLLFPLKKSSIHYTIVFSCTINNSISKHKKLVGNSERVEAFKLMLLSTLDLGRSITRTDLVFQVIFRPYKKKCWKLKQFMMVRHLFVIRFHSWKFVVIWQTLVFWWFSGSWWFFHGLFMFFFKIWFYENHEKTMKKLENHLKTTIKPIFASRAQTFSHSFFCRGRRQVISGRVNWKIKYLLQIFFLLNGRSMQRQ